MTTSPRAVGTTPVRWPELPWREWEPTRSTLHMWLQIVGKVRLALAPPLNHCTSPTATPDPSQAVLDEVEIDLELAVAVWNR